MLEIEPPFEPMEAKLVAIIPEGEGLQFEPKWDGFRCLAFRDGDDVRLQSKACEPLERYFPEVVEALRRLNAPRFVLDGELVVRHGDSLSFDALLQRIHPAASRVKRLAVETPATYVVFDMLAGDDGKSMVTEPLEKRRDKLEAFAAGQLTPNCGIALSPATTNREQAECWLSGSGVTVDGVMIKELAGTYRSGERAMQKVKLIRTADCVVGGFRYTSDGTGVGSLLLGLYDDGGKLDHVGFTSSFTKVARRELLSKIEPLIEAPGFTGNAPGGPSRWSTERSAEWKPLKPTLVIEVSYDHFTEGRFRHGTKLLRWRPDKSPTQCTKGQTDHLDTAALLLP